MDIDFLKASKNMKKKKKRLKDGGEIAQVHPLNPEISPEKKSLKLEISATRNIPAERSLLGQDGKTMQEA